MENDKNFLETKYKKKYKKLYGSSQKNNIQHTFNIIDVFYKKQDEICKGEENNINNEKIQYSEIKNEYWLEVPKINPKDNIYFSTDHHGDLSAFLFSLLESGVAKFKENEPSTVYFNMNTNKVIENRNEVEKYIKKNGIIGLVPIPNLEINPEFNGKFICGGDLIDRGGETDNCFCLMYHLLNQNGAENKIEYIVGNHEEMVLKNTHDPKLNPNTYYNGNNAYLIRKSLINLTKQGKLKLASPSGKTIFSHTVFNKKQIFTALNIVIENKDDYFNKKRNEGNFTKEIKEKAKNLKQKIKENEEFNEEDIKFLTEVLNDLFIKKVKSLKNIKYQTKDDIFMIDGGEKSRGLLWQRQINEEDKLNGLFQVVGHEAQADSKMPKLENRIIRADAVQSCGYNEDYSNAVLLHFENDKCIVKKKEIKKSLIIEKSENNIPKKYSFVQWIKNKKNNNAQKQNSTQRYSDEQNNNIPKKHSFVQWIKNRKDKNITRGF